MADYSDELHIIPCGACSSVGKVANAVLFCQQCQQGLCLDCQRDHQKFPATREHEMTNVAGRTPSLPTIPSKQPSVLLRCDYHDTKCVEFICNDHVELHCSLCRFVKHAKCNTKNVSSELCKSVPTNELDFALTSLEQINTSFDVAKRERKNHIEEMIRMKQVCIEEMRNLKERLERLFRQLDLKAAQKVAEVDKCVAEFTEKVMLYEDAMVHISKLSSEIKDVLGSEDPLTIVAARTKVQKLKSDFTMLLQQNDNNIVPLRLVFNQDTHITDILSTCESLGEVGTVVLPQTSIKTDQSSLMASSDLLHLLLSKKIEHVPQITSKLAKGPTASQDGRVQDFSLVYINQPVIPTQPSIASSGALDSAYSETSSLSSFRNSPIDQSMTAHLENATSNVPMEKGIGYTYDRIQSTLGERREDDACYADDHTPELPIVQSYRDESKEKSPVNESVSKKRSTWAAIAQKSPVVTKDPPSIKEQSVNSKVFKNIRLKSRKEFAVNLQHESGDCDITGSSLLPDGSLVLCDHYQKTVKVFGHDFKLIHSKRFNDHPWDVAAVGKNEIVVTLTRTKFVQYLGISDSGLSTACKFKTKQMCWGIESMNEHTIICCHDNPGNGIVEVRTRQGQVLHKISEDADGNSVFLSPFYVVYDNNKDLAYITDGKNNSVTCVSFKDNAIIYNTKIEYLRWPKGVLVDQNSNLLISAHFIDQLKMLKGKYARECVTFCDAIRPQSLSFRWDDLVMIITTGQGQKIMVYQFEYK